MCNVLGGTFFTSSIACQQATIISGTFKDIRDNTYYKWVEIGEQTWMAENLNNFVTGSRCYEDQSPCSSTYGRLYSWSTAMTICPEGWHLPNDAEWEKLLRYVDGTGSNPYDNQIAGKKLMATSGWVYGVGTDDFGFSALPGGGALYKYLSSYIVYNTSYGAWWSASQDGSGGARVIYITEVNDVYIDGNNDKRDLHGVRCVKD